MSVVTLYVNSVIWTEIYGHVPFFGYLFVFSAFDHAEDVADVWPRVAAVHFNSWCLG